MYKLSGRVSSQERSKYGNAALIYQLIDLNGPVSRVNLAQQSALAPASVTNLTRQLMENGLIRELAQEASTGGRPAISLATNQEQLLFISCRLGRTELITSAMNLAGDTLYHQTIALNEHDETSIVSLLHEQIHLGLSQIKEQRVIAIAVTLAGLIDPTTGEVYYTPNHEISGLNLVNALSDIGLPVYVGNDNRALTLAEYYLGSAHKCEDFILVTIHNGVGAGIVSDGQLLSGKHRTVGEIGHVQIDPFGERCHCGNFGCLETVVSNQAIINQTRTLIQRGHVSSLDPDTLSIDNICRAAENGDGVAMHIIKQTAEYMGHVLSILVNVFNPEKILLAGEIVQSAGVLFPSIQEHIERRALNKFNSEMHLDTARYQSQGTIGGYALIKRAMHNGDLLSQILNSDNTK
jgi:N-acetylglucosamine repressor